jgi:hypothetical protein
MADWSTIASLGTAGGTLVLAFATFSSVRFGQRATRIAERSTSIAERALLLGLRPVLAPSRVTDPPETVRFGDGRMVGVEGGMAAVEHDGERYYFVIPLRNVGNGLAVLQAWPTRRTPNRSSIAARAATCTCRRETPASGRERCASPTTRSVRGSTRASAPVES